MTIENYRIFNPIFDEDMIDKLDVELLDEDFIEQDALTYSEQLEINRGLAQWIKEKTIKALSHLLIGCLTSKSNTKNCYLKITTKILFLRRLWITLTNNVWQYPILVYRVLSSIMWFNTWLKLCEVILALTLTVMKRKQQLPNLLKYFHYGLWCYCLG